MVFLPQQPFSGRLVIVMKSYLMKDVMEEIEAYITAERALNRKGREAIENVPELDRCRKRQEQI